MKTDFKKDLDCYRAALGKPRIIEVPTMQYLMVDGRGAPGTESFTRAIESLYPVAYRIKFASKKNLDRDYVVPPLEGLWWADDMDVFTTSHDKSQWSWTLMIMVPDWIDASMFSAAGDGSDVRLETLSEGTCAQTLHVGSFDDEGAVVRHLHDEFIPSQGLALTGKHHEIYLSDFRRVEPARLRTILRQPCTAP
jgi:hypothetical protein